MREELKGVLKVKFYDKDGNFLFDAKTLADNYGNMPSLEKEKVNESEKETSRD